MRFVALFLQAAFFSVSFLLFLLAVGLLRISRGLRAVRTRTQPSPAPTDDGVQPEFVKAEMIDGPADGHEFPIPLDDPPPRVPFKTREGIYWYIPKRRDDQSVVLQWDGYHAS